MGLATNALPGLRKGIVGTVLVLSAMGLVARPASAQIVGQKETLRGLPGVGLSVHVQDRDNVAERWGLSADTIRADVELKLRLAKIALFTNENLRQRELPYLAVRMHLLLAASGSVLYTFDLELRQLVTLKGGSKADGSTWSSGYYGQVAPEEMRRIRDHIKDQVDLFLNDWLAVNPK